SSLYVTDIGYYPDAAHHYCERNTPINQFVLIYCVDGAVWYRVGNMQHEVARGEFFILPPGIPHSYGADENNSWTIYWVHFSGEHAAIYAENMQTPQKINVAFNSRIMDRISIFEEILSTLQSGDSLENLRYASSLLHHFLASMRYLKQFRTSQVNAGGRLSFAISDEKAICENAIHFMRENIEYHISLQKILDYIGYSQSHFSAMFKRQMGISPHAFFNRMKMEQACELLRETDMKINQICHKLGIKDQFYFSRLFSKVIGVSPSAYRKGNKV
ncbi:MAG: AraC family transcriptional regulator, partial [Bacteroidaceae bacterium]